MTDKIISTRYSYSNFPEQRFYITSVW